MKYEVPLGWEIWTVPYTSSNESEHYELTLLGDTCGKALVCQDLTVLLGDLQIKICKEYNFYQV